VIETRAGRMEQAMTPRIVAPWASLLIAGCGASSAGFVPDDTGTASGSHAPSGSSGGSSSGPSGGSSGGDAGGASSDGGAGDDDAGGSPSRDASTERKDASADVGGKDAGAHTDGGASGGCSGAAPGALVGWASVSGMSVTTTMGGAGGPSVTVSTLSDLNSNAGGSTARTIVVQGKISGNVTVGSNKTLVGACGAEIDGHIQMSGSVNVIVRDLTVVGYNCTDNPSDCSGGADAVTVEKQAHHLWFDHLDISDGSDGNLDITHASDFITLSWTKFHYSGRRTDPAGAAGGHQFSNLVGHSDSNASEDTGHLRITFHHDWWGDNVVERMPRVRFGQVHVFDSLYTAAGDDYCIGVGVDANIRDENNVFAGVKDPIDSTDYSNGGSIIQSAGNLLQSTTGTTGDIGGAAFKPPYAYTLDPASSVEAAVESGAGPQ
jgi:pectate lyase